MPLRYVKADAISDTIKPLVSKEATVIPYGPTNTLIITDSASNIRRLTNIIDQIDVSTYQETIKLVPIQYADANQLVQQLGQIFGDDTRRQRARTAGHPPRARRAAAAAGSARACRAATAAAARPRARRASSPTSAPTRSS